MAANLFACLVATTAHAMPQTFFVAPDGNDQNTGLRAQNGPKTGDGPLASLEGARDAIRRLKTTGKMPREGVVVEFQAGTYELSRPVAFDAGDSGTQFAPIIYRAAPGQKVRISGGKNVNQWFKVTDPDILAKWTPEARENVRMAPLALTGISDFGKLQRRITGGPERTPEAALELFFDDKVMTLARWPNVGFEKITSTPEGEKSAVFGFDNPRLARWKDEPDLWAHGYWFWDWADSHEKIRVDPEKKLITLQNGGGVQAGKRFYVENALSELDSPGEWYLDRARGTLYFWPPRALDGENAPGATVSMISNLATFQNASHISLQGLTLEATRGAAVKVRGGDGIEAKKCLVRNIGTNAFEIDEGQNHAVRDCEITQTGEGAVTVTGGERQTLTPCNFVMENNDVHDWSYWIRSYRSAIRAIGVGMRISHNRMHGAPHSAILVGGNDIVTEYNEIYDVCNETGDCGAWYMGRDWTSVGNDIRFNYFHDINGPGMHGSNGLYFDDSAGGSHIYGNFFKNVPRAVFLNAGRYSLVENNLFVDCTPAVFLRSREYAFFGSIESAMIPNLLKVPYKSAVWRQKYPFLTNILEDEPAKPKHNVFRHNVVAGTHEWAIFDEIAGKLAVQDNNYVPGFQYQGSDPGFVDAKNGDYRLKPDSGALKLGFKQLPFDQMGLLKDKAAK